MRGAAAAATLTSQPVDYGELAGLIERRLRNLKTFG